MFSFVSGGYWELRMRFSHSPYNSDSSDMLDVLSRRSEDITRKSTWIFKIWLRFLKYGSPLFQEWNFHGYERVVMILERFEVRNSKTLPPLHFQKKSSTHRGSEQGLEGSDRQTVKIILRFRWIGGHLCRNCDKENGWKCLYKEIALGVFFSEKKKTLCEYRGPAILNQWIGLPDVQSHM